MRVVALKLTEKGFLKIRGYNASPFKVAGIIMLICYIPIILTINNKNIRKLYGEV